MAFGGLGIDTRDSCEKQEVPVVHPHPLHALARATGGSRGQFGGGGRQLLAGGPNLPDFQLSLLI